MLLPRILAPGRASLQTTSTLGPPPKHVLDALRAATGPSPTTSPTLTLISVRHATHQSQGRANGAKDGPGKRLGAKKSGGEYVIPGNIIFRQRGTTWFPGENCAFGRDHCVFAKESGYVRYYRDPRLHPKRQYIGVALEKDHTLPYPPNAARRRRLNMVAVTSAAPPQAIVARLQTGDAVGGATSILDSTKGQKTLTMGKGYAYREANWQIGRAAEKAHVKVGEFVPGDRWMAWRRSAARIAANVERKKLRNASKKGAKTKKAR